jgi:hypothetical protein
MIIAKIIGGLGNQLFQYAAGKALALANSCQLKLDVSGYDNYDLHNGYELDIFNIKAEIANPDEVSRLVGSQVKVARLLRRKLNLIKKTHFIERGSCYDPILFNIKQPVYLEGYWQSYKYLEHCEIKIRDELTFNKPLVGKNLEIAEHIDRVNSVSVHIRRGDYISNPAFAKVHGFVGIGYYNKAIQRICAEVVSPFFVVFSDDLKWAKENLQLDKNAIFVTHNTGTSSFEDMRLMSLCKHNIIANSTFSWWAARLNNNVKKIVIAPQKWLADRSVVADYDRFVENLIPQSWWLE